MNKRKELSICNCMIRFKRPTVFSMRLYSKETDCQAAMIAMEEALGYLGEALE